MNGYNVIPIPCLEDNYAYLIIDHATKISAAVDPVEPLKVKKVIDQNGCDLKYILTTHKHWDHSGGNEQMAAMYPNVEIVGGDGDSIPAVTKTLSDGDRFSIGSLKMTAYAAPCHTREHLLYLLESPSSKSLFTGDTLFIGGCGRFFEGIAAEMHRHLNGIVASLPDATLVWCGHEYTVQNLAFCREVEPKNAEVAARLRWASERRGEGHFTVPSTIAAEKRTNVFMRVSEAAVKQYTGKSLPVDVMSALRTMKNAFKTKF